MFDQNEENKFKLEPWNIEPESKSNLEMRLIVYETEGMENLNKKNSKLMYIIDVLQVLVQLIGEWKYL